MKAQILKSMVVEGRKLVAGDIIEVKGWRHAKTLANNRYIKLIEEDVLEEKVAEAPKPKATKKAKEEIVE